MTSKRQQITNALTDAGLTAEQYTIRSYGHVEVAVYDEDGDLDRSATEQAALDASSALGWDGVLGGTGSWHLRGGWPTNRQTAKLISDNAD